MKKLRKMIALLMVTTCILPSAACRSIELSPGMPKAEEENISKETEQEMKEGKVQKLAQAVYPEMAQYPVTDGFDYDEEAYEAWQQSKWSRVPENKEYQNGIREFYEVAMQEFLQDTEGKNKIFSPLNVYLALAMLAETVEGEGRNQILEVLHADSMESLRNNANILWNANYCDDGTVNSLLASSLWLSEGLEYNQDTLALLAQNYYASSFQGIMGSAEYNQMLQEWLDEQTGGILKEQAAAVEMDPQTIFALATTVYFRAKWDNEFMKENTKEDTFYEKSGEVTCEFMNQSGTNTYYWGENFGAISRRLKNSGNMLLILPDEDVTAESLLTDSEVMDFIYNHNEWENQKFLIVNQSIPKFDATSDFSLVDGLKKLGITDVFDEKMADFSPLLTGENKGAAISEAKHAARVMIDEEGCIAAAFTVILACGAARPPEEVIDFVLNRPFLFVLKGQDGQPLFIGIVNQPN